MEISPTREVGLNSGELHSKILAAIGCYLGRTLAGQSELLSSCGYGYVG